MSILVLIVNSLLTFLQSPLPVVEGSEDVRRLRDACEAMQTSKTGLEQELTRLRDELHGALAEASRNVCVLSCPLNSFD